jgi:hypothetical protein
MPTLTLKNSSGADVVLPRKPILTRIFEALIEGRMQRAREEIALRRHLLPRELEAAGGQLNERNEDSLPFAR